MCDNSRRSSCASRCATIGAVGIAGNDPPNQLQRYKIFSEYKSSPAKMVTKNGRRTKKSLTLLKVYDEKAGGMLKNVLKMLNSIVYL